MKTIAVNLMDFLHSSDGSSGEASDAKPRLTIVKKKKST